MTALFRSSLLFLSLSCEMLVPSTGPEQRPPSLDAFQVVSRSGVPTDWTHRHVIFSLTQVSSDTAISRTEPRYWLQQLRRRGSQAMGSVEAVDATAIAIAQLSRLDERKLRQGEPRNTRRRGVGDGDSGEPRSEGWPGGTAARRTCGT
jgi:hypothetical protein